jgi:hypothetical protein
MNKKEMLIEYIIQNIVYFTIIDNNIKIDEAMNVFYNSQIFEKLQDTETGLYLNGSAYIYEIFKEEEFSRRNKLSDYT